MRKLVRDRQKEERKARRNKIFGGVILMGIMLLSTLGYAFTNLSFSGDNEPTSTTINFKGYDFENLNGYWILKKDGQTYIFSSDPRNVPTINSEINSLDSYKNKLLNIKSENVRASSEIETNLNPLVLDIKEVSEVNCEENTIVIEVSSEQSIEQIDNCVYIKGSEENLVRISDAFLFKILSLE